MSIEIECASCQGAFAPSRRNQTRCVACRRCECGEPLSPRNRSGVCPQCRLEADPYSWQCPFCLLYYTGSHKCERGPGRAKPDPARLARLAAIEDLDVITGPPLPRKAALSLTSIPLPLIDVMDRSNA